MPLVEPSAAGAATAMDGAAHAGAAMVVMHKAADEKFTRGHIPFSGNSVNPPFTGLPDDAKASGQMTCLNWDVSGRLNVHRLLRRHKLAATAQEVELLHRELDVARDYQGRLT